MRTQVAVVWSILAWYAVASPVAGKAAHQQSLLLDPITDEQHIDYPQNWQARKLSHEVLDRAVKIILPFSVNQIRADDTLPVFCDESPVNQTRAFAHLHTETNLIALPVDGLPDRVIICRMSHDDLSRLDRSTYRRISVFLLWLLVMLLIILLTLAIKCIRDWYYYDEFDHAYGL